MRTVHLIQSNWSSPGSKSIHFGFDQKEHIEELLETLSEREYQVLHLRYGLDDDRYRTLKEAGNNPQVRFRLASEYSQPHLLLYA